jgi:PAS domain S-box-containing protein
VVALRGDLPPRSPSREEVERLCLLNLLGRADERVFFKDRESRFLLVSDAWLRAEGRGRSLSEVIGKTDFDIFSAPHAGAALQDERQVLETGEPLLDKVQRETFGDRPDAWVSTTTLPLRDEQQNIIGTWGITRDVTTHVETAQALDATRASELQHRMLFEHNPEPMMAYYRSTLQIIAVSKAAIANYGYSREEFLTMRIHDLTPPEDLEALERYTQYSRSLSEPPRVAANPWRHMYKDGTIIDVEITSDFVVLDGHECRIALCRNVTERNRAAAALAAAYDEALEVSNMKSAFLANMGHEIRTPMNGVIGMTELMLGTELTAEQREYAEQVAHSSKQMMSILTDLLDVSTIKARQLELDVSDFAVRETVEQACAVASLEAQAKGLTLEVEIADDVPQRASGDGRRLRQVLVNLVSNAVKFTSEGTIGVRAAGTTDAPGNTRIRIEVADTGIGIDPFKLERMFEPFTQGDASMKRRYGGTGLGLAIARELVEAMGGTIGADSEPGQGSTFWFELDLGASIKGDGAPR